MTIKAIDLFAGAGGFTLSAIEAEVNVLAAIEFDEAAANTYKENFIKAGHHNIDLRAGKDFGDINKVDPLELRESLNLKKGELDLILGGPPCQGFSTHRIKDAGVNDPRNTLLLRYFEFVNEFNPKAFLVENVAGLLWERHKDFLDKFLSLAEDAGYTIKFCGIVNAKDYGVPQNRKRVFIYGLRQDLDTDSARVFPPEPTHFSPTSGKLPHWTTASTVFEKIPKELYDQYWEEYFKPKTKLTYEEAIKLLRSLKSGRKLRKNDPCNVHMQPTDMMAERFSDTPLNGSRVDAGEKHRLKCHFVSKTDKDNITECLNQRIKVLEDKIEEITNNKTTTAKKIIEVADLITMNGGKGVVQGDCICAFTGKPHSDLSSTVKAGK